ncbi:MAG: hypothetical protein GXX09_00705 [Syntrophomonadaceae bacterium]|nr:hypothetical protein [Syntrophomonadaceae bacterium]
MFGQLLGKPLWNYDISVFEHFTPETILEYHHHSDLDISLDTYRQLQQLCAEGNENAGLWIHFFTEVLGAGDDLAGLEDNQAPTRLGPYYYPATNTVIYFQPGTLSGEPATDADIRYLLSLAEPPIPNEKIVRYHQNLKR